MYKTNSAWVPFYRSTIYDPVFKDKEIFILWVWLLCNSCYKETTIIHRKLRVVLKPGDVFVESRAMVAAEIGITERKYRTAIKLLEELDYLTHKTNNKYTVISLIKWGFYKDEKEQSDQLTTNRRPGDDQHTTDSYINNKNNKKNINKYNYYNYYNKEQSSKGNSDTSGKYTGSANPVYKKLEIEALQRRIARMKESSQNDVTTP